MMTTSAQAGSGFPEVPERITAAFCLMPESLHDPWRQLWTSSRTGANLKSCLQVK